MKTNILKTPQKTKLLPTLILDYNHFFGVDPPENKISLIKHISKNHILFELCGLNYRLKSRNKTGREESIKTQTVEEFRNQMQLNELKHFTQINQNLHFQYLSVFDKLNKSSTRPVNIFNRQACLYAIEEILNSNEMETSENFVMAKIDAWDGIMRYFLAVNFVITQIKKEIDEKKINLELVNPKILALNELSIESHSLFTLHREY